ncbi:MAG TPA: outer membrane beta-barrel protein [Acidobacteriaceae bacterium]|jgi:outer membrane immunogenic protein|nr:outer membrane beta-barrel protein [Acidobacteriaceae bacterium]
MSKRNLQAPTWVAGVLFALVSTAGLPALASDMFGLSPFPPAPPAFSWTGVYGGANLGGGWHRQSTIFNGVTILSGTMDGVIGGGQLGANWQMGSIVLGAELDIQGSSESKSVTTQFPGLPAGVTLTEEANQPWTFTYRGRLGWAFANGWLFYVTGGGAWIDADRTFTGSGPGGGLSSTFDLSHAGWSFGGGVEGALVRDWSWKVEYLHLATDRFTTTVNIFGTTKLWNAKLADNFVRLGVNYRFYAPR